MAARPLPQPSRVARKHSPLAALVPCLALTAPVLASVACGKVESDVRVSVGPSLVFPKGILDDVSKVTLAVYDKSDTLGCDTPTGTVNATDATIRVATKELTQKGCSPQVRFCGDLEITKSNDDRIFSATATDSKGRLLASGCSVTKVNQDTLPLSIKMVPFVAPAVCGNGTLEVTETCDEQSELCDASCQTTEFWLSNGGASANTVDGGAGDKFDPAFLWPRGTGTDGRFFAFYTDKTRTSSDIGMRGLSDTLTTLSTPPVLKTASIFLPNGGTFPPSDAPKSQASPHAALALGRYFVVFQDDQTSDGGQDIHLRSMDASLVAEQGLTAAVGINGANGAGKPGIQSLPQISAAANGTKLLVAWQDDSTGGAIWARTYTPNSPPVLGTEREISQGSGNRRVAIAPLATGWLLAWESNGDIFFKLVNDDGIPQGAEQRVNDSTEGVQERPRVASLGDGRFAIVWSDKRAGNADVYMQRYTSSAGKVSADQSKPINDAVTEGDQITPAVAGIDATGGSYMVVWHDVNSGHVRGRFMGGTTGSLPNYLTGQTTEFQASRDDAHTRANPQVVFGGAGPSIAVGWEDKTTGAGIKPGIYVRRIPGPLQ
jgi:hypothetical protein